MDIARHSWSRYQEKNHMWFGGHGIGGYRIEDPNNGNFGSQTKKENSEVHLFWSNLIGYILVIGPWCKDIHLETYFSINVVAWKYQNVSFIECNFVTYIKSKDF